MCKFLYLHLFPLFFLMTELWDFLVSFDVFNLSVFQPAAFYFQFTFESTTWSKHHHFDDFYSIPFFQGNTTDRAWLNREYAVLSDLLTFYEWLFDVRYVCLVYNICITIINWLFLH